MNERHDDLQEIIDAALREMAAEEGDGFDPQACNLAEFCRRTGLTRSRARTVRAHGFRALPHGNSGRRAAPGVLAGHTGLVDDLLRKGVTNSQVIFERLLGQGYAGGLTTVKTYIAAHRDLDWQHLFGRFREGQPRFPELDRRHVAQRRVDPEVVVPVHVVRELGP